MLWPVDIAGCDWSSVRVDQLKGEVHVNVELSGQIQTDRPHLTGGEE